MLAKDDPVGVAKALTNVRADNQALVVKAGVVEGQMLQPEGLKALAELPSRDALRAQLGSRGLPLAGLRWRSLVGLAGSAPQTPTLVVRPGAAAARQADRGSRRSRSQTTGGRLTASHGQTWRQIAEELDKLTLLEAAQL